MLAELVTDAPHADAGAFAAIRSSGLPVALFGAGDMARYVAAYLRENGIEPSCVCDNAPSRQGALHAGLPVVSYEKFRAKMAGAGYHIVVAVGPAQRDGIYAQLEAAGEKNRLWYLRGYELCGPKLDLAFFRANLRQYEAAYAALADQRSREVFVSVLNAKLGGDMSLYEKIRSEDLYFDRDLVSLGEHEVFLDVGAYRGAAIAEFAGLTGGKYDGIIALEPDGQALAALRELQARERLHDMEIHACGAWHETARLSFDGGRESSSRLSGTDSAKRPLAVEVKAIDSLLGGRRVTYMAMDIEGAERNALLGAERTIKNWAPKMAVCAYHRREDLFDLPLLLRSFVPGYKFYLRHYTKDQTETVLYAL